MEHAPQADEEVFKEDPPRAYTFGIELEYCIKLENPTDWRRITSPDRVRQYLADAWNQAGKRGKKHVRMEPNYPYDKSRTYNVWRIVDEGAMEPSAQDEPLPLNQFPLEFVSPIFHYGRYQKWESEIKKFSNYLLKYTLPDMNDTTGLHIHVAPKGRRWQLYELQRIATAIVHFHKPLREIFPEHRYTQAYSKCNFKDNPLLQQEHSGSIAGMIWDVKTVDELIKIINAPVKKDTKYTERKYAWNFTNNSEHKNICLNPTYTMEFRSPRSTTGVEVIKKWIVFTVTFLHASVTGPENVHNDFPGDVDGLKRFLLQNRPPGSTDNLSWDNFDFF